MNPTQVGNRSEAALLSALIASGRQVLIPFGDGGRYDLVAEEPDGRLVRVQVKTARLRGDVISFRTCSQTGGGSQHYRDDVDFFGVHEPITRRCFLVPVHKAPTLDMSLRLAPARNGQRKGLHWAADYELRPAAGAAEAVPTPPLPRSTHRGR